MKRTYQIQSFAVCHMGKVRKTNQDNLYFQGQILMQLHPETYKAKAGWINHTEQAQMFGVFDGMGGHESGERASYLTALEAKAHWLSTQPKNASEIWDALNVICHNANDKVCNEMKQSHLRMGTTVSMLGFYQDAVVRCNLGDSPMFRYRNGQLEAFYEEHTEREMCERLGVEKNNYALTRYVGVFPEENLLQPTIRQELIEQGDVYIICSDGLTDMVSADEIRDTLASDKTLKEKAEHLLQRALAQGGKDNTTIMMIEVQQGKMQEEPQIHDDILAKTQEEKEQTTKAGERLWKIFKKFGHNGKR